MKISVIIPLYNAEKYIQQCLNSLLNQTIIDDMEILVVDDHGKDNSVEQVNYVRTNHKLGNHIFIYETPFNSGAWAARNLGIDKATGEWLAFVDADDWCEPDMYETLFRVANENDADFSFCYAQKEFANGKRKKLKQPLITNGPISAKTKKILFTSGVAYFWTGLYNKQFLLQNEIKFPQGKFSEDSFFWWHAISCCHSIAYCDKLGYHYRIQSNSVSKIPDSEKHSKKQSMYNDLIYLLREKSLYSDFKVELDYLYIKKGLLIPLIIYAVNTNKFESAVISSMITKAKELGIDIKINRYLKSDIIYKCLLLGFKKCPLLMRFLFRILIKTDPF